MDKETLEKLLKEQLNHLVEIRSYSKIWLDLHNAFQADAKYNSVYRIAPYFWQITLENYQHRFLLEVAKLYEESNECLSIQKMINICEQNQKLFPKEHRRELYCHSTDEIVVKIVPVDITKTIAEAKEKYATVAETRDKLFALRDKDLAHFDKKKGLDLKQFYQDTALNRDKFEEMICVAENILNSFLTVLTDTAVCTKHVDIEDFERLLKVARKGIESEYPHLITGD